jgi:APA family basic amino acid/polyamine antiporter
VFQLNFSNIFEAKQVAKGTENGLMNVLSPFGILIALGVCQVGTLFSSDAWNNITMIGGEVKNPEKTLTRGLIFGTLLVTILYLLINIVYLCILPLQGVEAGATIMERGIQFASEDRVAAAAASLIGGNTFTVIIAILIMISTFGCNNGLIIMGARTSYKMAEEGMFFQKFKKINKALVPSVALWGQCFWASMLCISGQYGNLLDYIMGVVILFYILTIFGIFVLRRTMPDAPRPIKVPLYPLLPILYIVLASVILFILMSEKPQYTYPGILIVLLGVPLFYWFRRGKKMNNIM